MKIISIFETIHDDYEKLCCEIVACQDELNKDSLIEIVKILHIEFMNIGRIGRLILSTRNRKN